MDDIIRILIEIVSRLEGSGISYLVSGSVARNLYAEPRFTNDIDIVVELYEKQKPQVFALFKKDFYISEQQIDDAFKGIGFFNVIHLATNIKCDFILRKRDNFSKACFDRKVKEVLENRAIYFISKEDLVLQKLLWRKESKSEQQMVDVQRIIEHQKDKLDLDYLLEWGRSLHLFEALKSLI